jgi:hypothetical protein
MKNQQRWKVRRTEEIPEELETDSDEYEEEEQAS